MHPTTATNVDRRPPEQVMRLERLGSFHQCRLSFMRILTRRMAVDRWTFSRPRFEIDENGVGIAVYCAHSPKNTYSLVAFAHDLPDELRSDRVIAEAWDATFCLFDGVPTDQDLARLEQNVPFQEAGRVSEKELSLSRANRSARLWGYVVDTLARGEQPDQSRLNEVGYLMRTTAVYGSGKFGAADREIIANRPELQPPFQAEMLSVYLIRTFVRDLVNVAARHRGGKKAVRLDPSLARRLGIGNSTGLGMAPFIINHPILFSNWIMVREEAIARVRSIEEPKSVSVDLFRSLVQRSIGSISNWRSSHPAQKEKLERLNADVSELTKYLESGFRFQSYPWNRLMEWAETALSSEGQEWLASLILEPHGELVDGLVDCMADSNIGAFHIDGDMTIRETRALIEDCFAWALSVDWESKSENARAWYVSEEKLEPRLGERHDEPIEDYEQPLSPARDAVHCWKALQAIESSLPVSDFLLQHPEHRHTVRRAQMSRWAPYGEIRDNTISAKLMPIDMLRAKLSFFGAIHFDPRSDRWVRICMYSDAPYPEELSSGNADYWIYPEIQSDVFPQ